MNFLAPKEPGRREAAVAALMSAKPFSILARGDLELLLSASTVAAVRAGERVYAEEDWGDHLVLVVAGLLRTALHMGSGPSVTLDVVPAGRVAGCLSAECRHKHAFEALAMVDSTVLRIPRKVYARLLARNLDFSNACIQTAAEAMYDCHAARARLVLSSERRVLASLLWLHERLGSSIPMTRSDLAEVSAVARETAIRTLSPLEKKGWIRTRRGRIDILEPASLRQAAESPTRA